MWRKFFKPHASKQVFSKVKDSIWVHYWNHMRGGQDVWVDPGHPLYQIMKPNCPKSVEMKIKVGKIYR